MGRGEPDGLEEMLGTSDGFFVGVILGILVG